MDSEVAINFTKQLELVESLIAKRRLTEAEALASNLAQQARDAKELIVQIKALIALGDLQSSQGRFTLALETYFSALQLPMLDVPTELQAVLHNAMAIAYGNSGLLEDALRHYELACRLALDPKNRLRFEMNAALVHGNLGRWDDAINIFQSALAAGEGVLEPHDWFWAKQMLIFVQAQFEDGLPQPRIEIVERLLEQAQAQREELTTTDFVDLKADIHDILSDLFVLKGDLPHAIVEVQQALALIGGLNSPRREMTMLVNLAMIQTRLGQAQAALEPLLRALALGQDMGGKGYTAQIHQQFSITHEALENYQEALLHHRLFHEIDAEKKSVAAANRANILMTRVRLEQSELQARLERQRAEDLAILNRQLEAMTRTDVLTWLANRRAFNETLIQMLEQANRQQLVFSVAMLDLDHFKMINDTYSHLVGDAVLIEAAKILQQQRRVSDVVARFGGEEFVMILSGVTGLDAITACERIRVAFFQHDWRLAHPDLQVADLGITISIGLCNQPQDNAEGWLKQADLALYRAKANGRNQVSVL